jgi:hypothetical protein
LYFYIPDYTAFGALGVGMGMPLMLRAMPRYPLSLRDSSRTFLYMKIPQEAYFTMGQKCSDVWHAICSLNLQYNV